MMRRWAVPEEAVTPVCFVLSAAAACISGQHVAADGGYHTLRLAISRMIGFARFGATT